VSGSKEKARFFAVNRLILRLTTRSRRDGVRKRRKPTPSQDLISPPIASNNSRVDELEITNHRDTIKSTSTSRSGESSHANVSYPSPSSSKETGYIAGHSVLLSNSAPTQSLVISELKPGLLHANEAILSATGALILPRPAIRQVLYDAYFNHLKHSHDLLDPSDLDGPDASILLQQSICFAGSLMHHGTVPNSMELSHSLYEKAKTLIFLKHEKCIFTNLKAMCLLSIWSPNPSDSTSMDGPWYWLGTAMRVAIQLGMHIQSTYKNRSDAACRRRIWWFLVVSCDFTHSKRVTLGNN
jgi:hypothetical protein